MSFFSEIDNNLRNEAFYNLPILYKVKNDYSSYFSKMEEIDKKSLVLLLHKAISKIDNLTISCENDERDVFDVLCDEEFIFEDLIDDVIDDLELYK